MSEVNQSTIWATSFTIIRGNESLKGLETNVVQIVTGELISLSVTLLSQLHPPPILLSSSGLNILLILLYDVLFE